MHIYIYHSTDYGITFEVFHPFSKGNEPLLSNFSTITQEGNQPLEVEFCNYSIGDVLEYQWDFDNSGTIDSYEETPTHIYQDTGWYSVKLSVVGPDSTNSFVKQDYVHIIDTTTNISENYFDSFSISPNPFNDKLFISQLNSNDTYLISVFNLQGEKVFDSFINQNDNFFIDTSNLNQGVFILNISSQNISSNYKIIKS